MANEFVTPNLHVALVHFPIALLVTGTLIELFGFMWPRSSFRTAGRWMILIGALGGIPTAMSGMYALADVSLEYVPAVEPWKDLGATSPVWQHHFQSHMLRDHVALAAWGTGVAVLVSILWLGASDAWRMRLHLPLLALLLVACGLIISGAWHAGEAVYRYGTAVAVETNPATQPSLSDAVTSEESRIASRLNLARYVVPVESHMILAGTTVALALVSLGLSFRVANSRRIEPQVDQLAAALGPAYGDPPAISQDSDKRDTPVSIARLPSGRFWLLTVLLGLITALAGWWTIASSADSWSPRVLWEIVRQPVENATAPWLTRRLAHLGGGVSIVVLSLLLAITSRLAPRARLTLIILAILLLLVVAAQVWFGVLLTFDTMSGPLTRFN